MGSVPCPECGQVVPARELEHHLRRAHHLYLFRGARAPLPDTLAALLNALCHPDPDRSAYQRLEHIARVEQGKGAAGFVAALLGPALARVERTQLPGVCEALAEIVVSNSTGLAVTLALAAEPAPAVRRLVLNMVVKWPPPVERRLERAVRPLLSDPALPRALQLSAAMALLQTTGREGPRTIKLLRALVKGRGRAKGVSRLHRLEKMVGPLKPLQDLCRTLEERMPMRCPRCRVKLRRPEMVHHLWDAHGLVLDGRHVREPWQLIDEWLDQARPEGTRGEGRGVRGEGRGARDEGQITSHPSSLTPHPSPLTPHPNPFPIDPAVLERCRSFAQQLDPQQGLRRLQRRLLAEGFEEAEARRTLLAEAAQQMASLCPHCYELVPAPRNPPPRPMSVNRGRLSSAGYRCEVLDNGLFRRLEIEMPGRGCEQQQLPGRPWTIQGSLIFLAWPLEFFALIAAFLASPPLLPVVVLLAGALLLTLGVHLVWWLRLPPEDQAVDLAWKWMVPRLHADGFLLEDSAFLASLALVSLECGTPQARQYILKQLLPRTERVVRLGFGGARHLAALRRLALADAVQHGEDLLTLIVKEVERCFRGRLPLSYADGLLEGCLEGSWSRAELARLRVRLCEIAFEAGFEVRNLIEAARTAPALGEILRENQADDLARLRLLWSLRAVRPWDRHGSADTAFDLATDPARNPLFDLYPDLLLHHPLPARFVSRSRVDLPEEPFILLCGRGVILPPLLLEAFPRILEVNKIPAAQGTGFRLTVDEKHLDFFRNPEVLVSRLERWCRFYFLEFVPLVADVYGWQAPDVAAVLRAWGAVPCPDCHRLLLPVVGKVGVPLQEG